MGPYCTYIIDEGSLFFGNVVLNTTHSVNLHIRNIGQIPTEIRSQINCEHSVYSVTPEIISVEPFTDIRICLSFTPSAINVRQYTKKTPQCTY